MVLIIGPTKTYRFFFQKRKWKGTACFLGGIALVLYGWAIVGILVEGWGFINLFGDFFPTALYAARTATLFSRGSRARPSGCIACEPTNCSSRTLTRARLACRSGFLRNMPVIGTVLSLPVVRSVTDRLITKSRLPV